MKELCVVFVKVLEKLEYRSEKFTVNVKIAKISKNVQYWWAQKRFLNNKYHEFYEGIFPNIFPEVIWNHLFLEFIHKPHDIYF